MIEPDGTLSKPPAKPQWGISDLRALYARWWFTRVQQQYMEEYMTLRRDYPGTGR